MNEYKDNGEIKEIHERRGVVLYPARYEEKYNVYTVRACTSEEFGFYPTYIGNFPKRTLDGIKADYCLNTGKNPQDLDTKISYNKSKFRSVVSFEGETFSWNQVDAIFEGKELTEDMDDADVLEPPKTRQR